MAFLPTQPQSIGQILDSGFRLYFKGFKSVILISLLASLIGVVPSVLMKQMGAAGGGDAEAGIIFLMFLPVLFLVSFVAMTAIITKFQSIGKGENVGIGAGLRLGFRKFFPLLAASILYGIAVGAGMLLLLVPGIIIMVTMIFYSYAIILDNAGPLEALKKSHRLVWGNWWRTVLLASVPLIIMMVLVTSLMLPVVFIAAAMDFVAETEMVMLVELANALGQGLAMPMLYAVTIVLYQDLKLRKEGSDLMARIEGTPVAA